MGAYNFKPQFEDPIMLDLKRHTIRAKRKDGRRPKPGEVLSLYLGHRTKACRLMKRRRCVKVQDVRIFEMQDRTLAVVIDDIHLHGGEKNLLAKSDGFSDFFAMAQFWRKTHGKRQKPVNFTGDLIHWESDAEHAKHPIPDQKPKRPVGIRRANTRRARR